MRSPSTRVARGPILAIYALLIPATLAVWAWAFLVFGDQPVLLGTALLAYGFGLRHAVDADHIAAIDNVTRKLMQEGKRPVSVGFWFALGHSAVVVLAGRWRSPVTAVEIADAISRTLKGVGRRRQHVASRRCSCLPSRRSTSSSCVGVWKTFRQVRAGGAFAEEDLDLLLNSRGLLARLFRPLFRLITRSWHMLPLGSCSVWASTRRPRSRCSAFPRRRRRKACRSGRSWCFPRCSRRACR